MSITWIFVEFIFHDKSSSTIIEYYNKLYIKKKQIILVGNMKLKETEYLYLIVYQTSKVQTTHFLINKIRFIVHYCLLRF